MIRNGGFKILKKYAFDGFVELDNGKIANIHMEVIESKIFLEEFFKANNLKKRRVKLCLVSI